MSAYTLLADSFTSMADVNESSPKNNSPQMTLLELLRRKLVEITPDMSERQCRDKRNLILQHRNEFPSIIQEAIREAKDLEPTAFESNIKVATRKWLWGGHDMPEEDDTYTHLRYGHDHRYQRWFEYIQSPTVEWKGPNTNVDTFDQVEVAVRCYPWLLVPREQKDKYSHLRLSDRYCPLRLLFFSPKAISFIPLFIQLHTELLEPSNCNQWLVRGIYRELLCHTFVYGSRWQTPQDMDQTSLELLRDLRARGGLNQDDVRRMSPHVFHNSFQRANLRFYGDKAYLEERVRLLVGWNPSILKDCGGGWTLLQRLLPRASQGYRSGLWEAILLLFELGMTHYPLELGFLFHRFVFQNKEIRGFAMVCKRRWEKRIRKRLRIALKNLPANGTTSGRNVPTMTHMLMAAATNSEISLDGVYILLRTDPMAALNRQISVEESNR